MAKLHLNRLKKLVRLLETTDEDREKKGLPAYDQGYYVHPCGTPACALGLWAANSKRWGAVPGRWNGDRLYPSLRAFVENNRMRISVPSQAEIEFNLTYTEADELFGGEGMGGAKTGKEAAKYLRGFIKRKGRSIQNVPNRRG